MHWSEKSAREAIAYMKTSRFGKFHSITTKNAKNRQSLFRNLPNKPFLCFTFLYDVSAGTRTDITNSPLHIPTRPPVY